MRAGAGVALAAATLAAGFGAAQQPSGPWWRQDRLYQAIAGPLDAVAAIDNHTHLLWPEAFDARVDPFLPVQLRSTRPDLHGGIPLVEEAAYLAIKPHVWLDLSALPILYPVPDLAASLRKYLLFAPEKVLFGTDPSNYPTVPVGPEVQHAAASRTLREALYLALAGLVRDGVVDVETAVRFGRGVLRDNALRLYGWNR